MVVVVVGGGGVAQVAQDHHVLAQGEHCHTTNITIKIKIDFENHVVCLPYKPNPHPLVFTSFKFNFETSSVQDKRFQVVGCAYFRCRYVYRICAV